MKSFFTLIVFFYSFAGPQGSSTFSNLGLLQVKKCSTSISMNGYIGGQLLFQNLPKSRVEIDGRIENKGQFDNEGLVVPNTDTANILDSLFQNNGAFVDLQDIQIPAANFTNTGLLIKPMKGKVSVGIKEMNIINRTGPTTFSPAVNWSISPLSTVLGGSLSAVDDALIPNTNAPFADSLYFNITATSATHFIRIPIQKIPNCGALSTATFTQSLTTDWHTPANWCTGREPNYCTTAIIPAGKKCIITSNRKARAS